MLKRVYLSACPSSTALYFEIKIIYVYQKKSASVLYCFLMCFFVIRSLTTLCIACIRYFRYPPIHRCTFIAGSFSWWSFGYTERNNLYKISNLGHLISLIFEKGKSGAHIVLKCVRTRSHSPRPLILKSPSSKFFQKMPLRVHTYIHIKRQMCGCGYLPSTRCEK